MAQAKNTDADLPVVEIQHCPGWGKFCLYFVSCFPFSSFSSIRNSRYAVGCWVLRSSPLQNKTHYDTWYNSGIHHPPHDLFTIFTFVVIMQATAITTKSSKNFSYRNRAWPTRSRFEPRKTRHWLIILWCDSYCNVTAMKTMTMTTVVATRRQLCFTQKRGHHQERVSDQKLSKKRRQYWRKYTMFYQRNERINQLHSNWQLQSTCETDKTATAIKF